MPNAHVKNNRSAKIIVTGGTANDQLRIAADGKTVESFIPTVQMTATPAGSGTPKSWTLTAGRFNEITLDNTGHTINVPAPPASDGYWQITTLRVIQGAGGNKTITSWQPAAGTLAWSGGAAPVLKTAAGEWDLFQFIARRLTSGDQIIIGLRLAASS